MHADTPTDLGVRTTCISMSGGPPILPGAYNNGLHITQSSKRCPSSRVWLEVRHHSDGRASARGSQHPPVAWGRAGPLGR